MKIVKIWVFIFLFSMLVSSALAQTVCIYFFYGATCPHCKEEKIFLQEIKSKYPVEVHEFEVYYNQTNANLWKKISSLYGTNAVAVPMTFIGDKVFVGFVNGDGQMYNPEYKAYVGYSKMMEQVIAEYVAAGGAKCPSEALNTSISQTTNSSSWYWYLGIGAAILVIVFAILIKTCKIKVVSYGKS